MYSWLAGWLTCGYGVCRTVSQIVGAVRDKDVKWEGEGRDNGNGKVGGAGETENERILRERRRG